MSPDHHLHPIATSIARPSRARDWSDDIALGIAGFFGVLAVFDAALPAIVRDRLTAFDLSDQARVGTSLLALTIACLLAWPRSRAVGVMLGAAAGAAGSFLLLLELHFAALPVPLALLAVLIATAVRIDRLQGRARRRADRRPQGRRA